MQVLRSGTKGVGKLQNPYSMQQMKKVEVRDDKKHGE